MSDVETWLKAFLTSWRKQYSSLPKEIKSEISSIDNFLPPCQMIFLDFKEYRFQHLIVMHDKNRDDGEISVYGPVPLYEAADMLESILNDPRWDRRLTNEDTEMMPPGDLATFRNVLERHLLAVYHDLRRAPFRRPGPSFSPAHIRLTLKGFVWYIRGDITEKNPVEEAKYPIQKAKKSHDALRSTRKPEDKVTPSKTPIRGYGTYFYPPIWIGQPPQKSFKEKALGYGIRPEKVLEMKYKGKVLIVNNNGYIVIEEEDRSVAIRILNEIFGTCFLFDLPLNAVGETDVSKASIDPATMTMSSWGSGDSIIREAIFKEEMGLGSDPLVASYVEREVVGEDEIKQMMQTAEHMSQDLDTARDLSLLLESYTYLESSEYTQAFIISWLIIERHVSRLWRILLDKERISGKRRKKLLNASHITTDTMIETLHLMKHLSAEDYSSLMRLKTKRNRIIHSGEEVSKRETERCFAKAEAIMRKRVVVDH